MKHVTLALPELALIAATRAAAGVGLGLLLADHVPPGARRAVGWSLMLLGVFSTAPLAVNVIDGARAAAATTP
jgi:hypothetical protein